MSKSLVLWSHSIQLNVDQSRMSVQNLLLIDIHALLIEGVYFCEDKIFHICHYLELYTHILIGPILSRGLMI